MPTQYESTKYLVEQLKPKLGKKYYAGQNITISDDNVISATSITTDPYTDPAYYLPGDDEIIAQFPATGATSWNTYTYKTSGEGDRLVCYTRYNHETNIYAAVAVISKHEANAKINIAGSWSSETTESNGSVVFNSETWYYCVVYYNLSNFDTAAPSTAGFASVLAGEYTSFDDIAIAMLNQIFNINGYVIKAKPEALGGSATGTRTGAMGRYSEASNTDAFAVGYNSKASGAHSVAIGQGTASGETAFAACNANTTVTASGSYSAAIASGNASKATATNAGVIATQRNCTAAGVGSIVTASILSSTNDEQSAAIACNSSRTETTNSAVIAGTYLKSSGTNQLTIGKYNADATDALFVIGCGTNEYTDRRNIMEVRESGVTINGPLSFVGQSQAGTPEVVDLSDLIYAQDSHKEGTFPLNTDTNWSINTTGNISMSGRIVQINITTLLDTISAPLPINTILGRGCPPALGVARFVCMDSRGKAYFLEVDNNGVLKVGNPVPLAAHTESYDVSFFGSGTYVSQLYANQWTPF